MEVFMLTQDNTEYFKGLLFQRMDELFAGANKAANDLDGLSDRYPDFVDRASIETDTSFSFHLKERESRLMKKINRALEKLNNGDFGVCEECGRKISEERLKARPMAVLCIRCKRKQEAIEKIKGL